MPNECRGSLWHPKDQIKILTFLGMIKYAKTSAQGPILRPWILNKRPAFPRAASTSYTQYSGAEELKDQAAEMESNNKVVDTNNALAGVMKSNNGDETELNDNIFG